MVNKYSFHLFTTVYIVNARYLKVIIIMTCKCFAQMTLNKYSFHTSGEPGLVDRVLALHAGSRGFDSHRGHLSERFFRSNRPGYPHPVSFELENSGVRVAVGDCSVTERRRWRPPYQTGKTVHVDAKHYKHNEDGRTAPGVCGNGSVPLSHSGNVVTRIGKHTHIAFTKCWLLMLRRRAL